MKVITLTALVALATAGPVFDFESTNNTTTELNPAVNSTTGNGLPSLFVTRGVKVMYGKCVRNDATHEKACKVNLKSYSCLNSSCLDSKGKECIVAHGMKHFEAKCPHNELLYEWDWPWKAPK